MEYYLIGVLVIWNICLLRSHIINNFKIGYYEQKLKNRDIKDSVKDYGLMDVFK